MAQDAYLDAAAFTGTPFLVASEDGARIAADIRERVLARNTVNPFTLDLSGATALSGAFLHDLLAPLHQAEGFKPEQLLVRTASEPDRELVERARRDAAAYAADPEGWEARAQALEDLDPYAP